MKAIVQTGYGSPAVLRLEEIELPAAKGRGVVVQVHAASVNALDWHITRGMPSPVRLGMGIRTPRDRVRVRGVDFAGRVLSVGKAVTRVQPGDEVFGGANGSFAEIAAASEDQIALKPAGVTWEQAASLNIAGLTALQGLRDHAALRAGQSALIVGAGGGVGTFAVQLAKWLGARVTAVTRTESLELVRSLGADAVVDHRFEDFTRRNEHFDVVFDVGGSRPMRHYRRVMARNGVLMVVGGPAGRWLAPMDRVLKSLVLSPFVTQRFVSFFAKGNPEDLALLAQLVETGALSPVIDRRYPLREAPEAIAYLGAGRARGKVIVDVQS